MIDVIYASQTGTAQEYAGRTVRRLWKLGYAVRLVDIATVTVQYLLDTSVCIIIAATCGQGDLPSSTHALWAELLSSALDNKLFAHKIFSILGLGDSSYEHFNYAAKKIYRRLEQLGGHFPISPVYSDEQSAGGLDDGYSDWIDKVLVHLELTGVPRELSRDVGFMYTMSKSYESETKPECKGIVTMNQRLTDDLFEKDVRNIRIEIPTEHSPGDIAIIYPQSQPSDVQALCERLGWHSSNVYRFQPGRPDAILPEIRLSINSLLTFHLDIYSYPSRHAVKVLSRHATNATEAEKLKELATTDYDLYQDYIVRPKRSMLEVLQDFASVGGVQMEYAFDLFQLIRPRSFSIASHSGLYIDLAVALVKYRTKWIADDREGLASRYLSRVRAGDRVRLEIIPGDLSVSSGLVPKFRDVLLMGAGTGLAPLRSIIGYINGMKTRPQVHLFYGCRYLSRDCLYRAEFQLPHIAFHALGSRDLPDQRRHLDCLLRQNSALLQGLLLSDSSIVFLSGNNNLPKLVKNCIDEIVEIPGYSKYLTTQSRFFYECWS